MKLTQRNNNIATVESYTKEMSRFLKRASEDCPFCAANHADEVDSFRSVIALEDKNPVTQGHLLIIPRRHTQDFFTMSAEEKDDAVQLIGALQNKVINADPTVLGFNIGINCGEAAGQTVAHAHIHLIPRRCGDTQNPRGGVRGVIPEKMTY